MLKILVTGGAGFIGSTLVDRLISEGHKVAVIDDLSSGKRDYLNPSVNFYEISINSPELASIFEINKFDYVYHLAAQIDLRHSVANPENDNLINVLGGLNILKQCHAFGVKKIIFSSTGGAIYGEDVELPTTEAALAEPISPYGIHKLTFEKYLHYYHRVYNQDYLVLRFANVYGPRQYKGGEAGVVSIFIDNAVANKESKINGDGLQTRDYVYVDDVVEALVLAMSCDHAGCLNIATGVEKNLLEIISYIEAALGHEILKIYAEAKLGEQRRSCLSYAKAQEVLKWSPKVDLQEGIKRTVAWAKPHC